MAVIKLFNRALNDEDFVTNSFLTMLAYSHRKVLLNYLDWMCMEYPVDLINDDIIFASQYSERSKSSSRVDGLIQVEDKLVLLIETKINPSAWHESQVSEHFKIIRDNNCLSALILIDYSSVPRLEILSLQEKCKENPNLTVIATSWPNIDRWLRDYKQNDNLDDLSSLLIDEFLKVLEGYGLNSFSGYKESDLANIEEAAELLTRVSEATRLFFVTMSNRIRTEYPDFYVSEEGEGEDIPGISYCQNYENPKWLGCGIEIAALIVMRDVCITLWTDPSSIINEKLKEDILNQASSISKLWYQINNECKIEIHFHNDKADNIEEYCPNNLNRLEEIDENTWTECSLGLSIVSKISDSESGYNIVESIMLNFKHIYELFHPLVSGEDNRINMLEGKVKQQLFMPIKTFHNELISIDRFIEPKYGKGRITYKYEGKTWVELIYSGEHNYSKTKGVTLWVEDKVGFRSFPGGSKFAKLRSSKFRYIVIETSEDLEESLPVLKSVIPD